MMSKDNNEDILLERIETLEFILEEKNNLLQLSCDKFKILNTFIDDLEKHNEFYLKYQKQTEGALKTVTNSYIDILFTVLILLPLSVFIGVYHHSFLLRFSICKDLLLIFFLYRYYDIFKVHIKTVSDLYYGYVYKSISQNQKLDDEKEELKRR